jgi:hypothetical protein
VRHPAGALVVGLLDARHHGGRDGVRLEGAQRLVHLGQQLRRAQPGRHGDPPHQRAQLSHLGGRGDVVPDDVADHQHGGAVTLQEGVVPVAAHLGRLRRRLVPDDDLHVVRLGRIRQQGPLQALGELTLLPVQA